MAIQFKLNHQNQIVLYLEEENMSPLSQMGIYRSYAYFI